MVCGDVQVRCASQTLEIIDFEQIYFSCETYQRTFTRELTNLRQLTGNKTQKPENALLTSQISTNKKF